MLVEPRQVLRWEPREAVLLVLASLVQRAAGSAPPAVGQQMVGSA